MHIQVDVEFETSNSLKDSLILFGSFYFLLSSSSWVWGFPIDSNQIQSSIVCSSLSPGRGEGRVRQTRHYRRNGPAGDDWMHSGIARAGIVTRGIC